MALALRHPWAKVWKARRKSSGGREGAKQELKYEVLRHRSEDVQVKKESEAPLAESKEPAIKAEPDLPSPPRKPPAAPSQALLQSDVKDFERFASPFNSEELASPSPSLSKSPSATEAESSLVQLPNDSFEALPSNPTQEFDGTSTSLLPQAADDTLDEPVQHADSGNKSPPTQSLIETAEPLSTDKAAEDSLSCESAVEPVLVSAAPPTETTVEDFQDIPDADPPAEPEETLEESPIKEESHSEPVNEAPATEALPAETTNEAPIDVLSNADEMPTEPADEQPNEDSLMEDEASTEAKETDHGAETGAKEEDPSPTDDLATKESNSPTKEASPVPETGRLTRSKASSRGGIKEPSETASTDTPAPSKPFKKERKLTAKAAKANEEASNTEAAAPKKRATKAKAEPKTKTTPPKRKYTRKKGKEMPSPAEEAPAPPQPEPISIAPIPADQSGAASLSLTELTKLKLSTFFGKPATVKKPSVAAPPIRPQPSAMPHRPPPAPQAGFRPPMFAQPPNSAVLPMRPAEFSQPPRPMAAMSPPVGGPSLGAQDPKPASPPAEAAAPKTPKRRGKNKKVEEPDPELPPAKAPKVAGKPGPKPKATRAKKPGPTKPPAEAPEVTPMSVRSPSHPSEPVRPPHIEHGIPRTTGMARAKITLENTPKPRPEHPQAAYENFAMPFYKNSPGPVQPPHYRPDATSYPAQQPRDWAFYPPSSAPPSAPFPASHPYDPGFPASRAVAPVARDPSTMPHAPILPRSSGPGIFRPPPVRPQLHHNWEEPGQTKSLRHSSIVQSRRPSQYSDVPFYDSVPYKEPTPPAHYPQMPAYSSAPTSHYSLPPRSMVHQTPPPHYPYDYAPREYGRSHQFAHPPQQGHHDHMASMDYAQHLPHGSLQRDSGSQFPPGNPGMPSRNNTPAAPEAPQESASVPNKSSLKHLLN